MSGYADTMSRAVAASNRATELHYRIPDLTVEEQEDALALIRGLSADLCALLAENQQLRVVVDALLPASGCTTVEEALEALAGDAE